MKQSILFIRSFLILFISSVFLFSCAIDQEKNPDVLPALEISNVPYGSDTRQKMDIFLPAGRSSDKTPVIIYIHGGAWVDGDKSEFSQVKPFVEQSFPGFAMISFNYNRWIT